MTEHNYDLPADVAEWVERHQLTPRRLDRIMHTVNNRHRGLMMMMEDVHNPHNLAAIARSCDAFGIQQVGFTMESEEAFDPENLSIVTSASASKWLDYRFFDKGTADALTTLKAEGYHIMATWVNEDAKSIYDVDFTQYDKLVLMVGNEHAGISQSAVQHADTHLYIPMQGMIESFNVSVAAALCLFEITRQRRASGQDWGLDREDYHNLIRDFALRTMRPLRPRDVQS